MATLTTALTANQLGTYNLEETYLTSANDVIVGQLYSNLILAQPSLDVTKIDPGLATLVGAYQSRMQTTALFYITKLLPSFITTVDAGANFEALVNTALATDKTAIEHIAQDEEAAQHVAKVFATLSTEASSVGVGVNSLKVSYNTGQKAIGTFATDYDAALTKAIGLLSDSAKQLSAEIDALQAAIAQNIQDIVAGSEEVGSAVTQLGTGIITTIAGTLKEPGSDGKDNGKNGDKNKPSNNEQPSVEFAVEAIQASTSGQTKVSAAGHALNANNAELAAAYQAMAEENALIAIAKVIQVQNQLFLNALTQLSPGINELVIAWSSISTAYATVGQQVKQGVTQAEADDLIAEVRQAQMQWQALAVQLTFVKQFMTGTF